MTLPSDCGRMNRAFSAGRLVRSCMGRCPSSCLACEAPDTYFGSFVRCETAMRARHKADRPHGASRWYKPTGPCPNNVFAPAGRCDDERRALYDWFELSFLLRRGPIGLLRGNRWLRMCLPCGGLKGDSRLAQPFLFSVQGAKHIQNRHRFCTWKQSAFAGGSQLSDFFGCSCAYRLQGSCCES